MNLFKFILDWINENPGKTAGGFLGFILGIFLLTFGITKTLLIIILILIGFIFGKFRDDNISIVEQVKGLFRRK
ncbi:MAG: DUF2273 domain-containing protein [bacterium]|nr:DUF2273 domain-containing protein [bacterium]